MIRSKVTWIIIFHFLFFGKIFTQTEFSDLYITVPEICLVDVEPQIGTISLPLTSPTDAGAGIGAAATDDSRWINYTMSLSPTSNTRMVSAQITGGVVPSGLSLQVSAANYSGSGSGNFGATTGTITLNTTPQSIITGIGGSFTGNGVANGHQLTFNLVVTDYAQMRTSSQSTIEVTYTITEQ